MLNDAALAGSTNASDHRTTDGVIAIRNLQAQIDGQQWRAIQGQLTVADRASLVELIALRGTMLGRIADYELAAALSELHVRNAPADGSTLVVRARIRALLHHFQDALRDLEIAQGLGTSPAALTVVNAERAAVFQAIGCYEEALRLRREAADYRADFETLGALACLYAEQTQIAVAEQLFDEARRNYRGVSPFPLALLDFQCGYMWMGQGDLQRARTSFAAACRRVPGYAPAQGHLAEVEAALGEVEAAISRLRPLTDSSDDPDYAAQLARILGEADRAQESCAWRALAAARYDELIVRHPAAFADHAAEFWLMGNADPEKALRLARKNLEVRHTPRAYELLSRAAEASNAAGEKNNGPAI